MNNQQQYDLIIEAGRTELHYWKDIWRYRELFYFLSWRDILVRYKQTIIGIAWSVIRPVLTMIVFTVIFGKLAKLPSEGIPYPILVFSAMLPWQFFSTALNESSNSLINNANLVLKVYFPRIIIPISAVIVSLIDILVSFFVLILLMFWYKFIPCARIIFLPFFFIIAFGVSVGAGLWFAALNIKYRDFRYIIPFIVQFSLYISPVGFSSSIIPDKWRLFYSLNPMVGVIDGFRWVLLNGEASLYWPGFVLSFAMGLLFLVSGIGYFRKTEKTFADLI